MKRVGISRFNEAQASSFTELSSNLSTTRYNQLQTQLSLFKDILLSSSDELMHSSKYRGKFLLLCAKIGINPLSLYDKKKNFQEFYNLLCLKLIEFWNETRGLNGGLVSLNLFEKKYNDIQILNEDWEIILDLLKVLSPGVIMLDLGDSKFLSFDDEGLNSIGDENKILSDIMNSGNLSESDIIAKFNKDEFIIKEVLNKLVMKGYIWIDLYQGKITYWDPSLMIY